MTYTISIEPKKGKKGRVFRAFLLNYVTADHAWDCGSSETSRPVYVAYTASEQEVQAFTANLRTGRRAVVRNEYGHDQAKVELLKTAGHRFAVQRANGAAIVTAYLPELFTLDPGLVPERIAFLLTPPAWWVDRQVDAPPLRRFPVEERRELVIAGYFAAYLDRRTPQPIINDPTFHRQLYRAAQEQPWFARPSGSTHKPGAVFVYPEEAVGLELVALVDVSHATFEQFLRAETTTYYRNEVPNHGTTRIASRRRLLPDPPPAGVQLGLFDHLDVAA